MISVDKVVRTGLRSYMCPDIVAVIQAREYSSIIHKQAHEYRSIIHKQAHEHRSIYVT